jgi:hypothetical protein
VTPLATTTEAGSRSDSGRESVLSVAQLSVAAAMNSAPRPVVSHPPWWRSPSSATAHTTERDQPEPGEHAPVRPAHDGSAAPSATVNTASRLSRSEAVVPWVLASPAARASGARNAPNRPTSAQPRPPGLRQAPDRQSRRRRARRQRRVAPPSAAGAAPAPNRCRIGRRRAEQRRRQGRGGKTPRAIGVTARLRRQQGCPLLRQRDAPTSPPGRASGRRRSGARRP